MVNFQSILLKFDSKGEKTGWTYIHIPIYIAQEIKPDTKVSFRVKGKIDEFEIKQVAVMPMGEGDFILPINAEIRKEIRKKEGATVILNIELDKSEFKPSEDFMMCLEDDPKALETFKSFSAGHQRYYSNWIESAKTVETKTKRITQAVQGLAMGFDYGEMIRYFKARKNELEK